MFLAKYLSGLSPEVIAHALGLEVNYPLPEQDGCNSLIDIRCPIEQNEIVLYNLKMPILSIYPTVRFFFVVLVEILCIKQ